MEALAVISGHQGLQHDILKLKLKNIMLNKVVGDGLKDLQIPQHLLKRVGEEFFRLLEKELLPRIIDESVARYYTMKAVRLGVWRYLSAESRALLRAVAAWGGAVKSKVLSGILREIFLLVELETLKGKALLYGALVALGSGLQGLLTYTKTLLCLGISYLNNPPIFRFLG